jgi:hypothetical protein
VGPRAGLDVCGKSRPYRDSIPGPSSPYLLAIPTELSRPTNIYSIKLFFLSEFVACYLNQVVGFGDRLGYAVAATCLLCSHPEDGGRTFLRTLGTNLSSSTV